MKAEVKMAVRKHLIRKGSKVETLVKASQLQMSKPKGKNQY